MGAADEESTRHPALITEAAPSLEDQHRARVRRYTILMSFRVPALIGAAWVYSAFHSAIAALIIIGASIPLPWVAVLIANDRPPRSKDEPSRYPRQREMGHSRQEIQERQALEARPSHIIDGRM